MFGPTNVTVSAKDIRPVEEMTVNDKLIVLPSGETVFVEEEDVED